MREHNPAAWARGLADEAGAQARDEAHAQEEARIMLAARTDPTLFAPLYERYFPRIYGYCLRRVGSPEEAEDLTSAIFTSALSGLQGYRGGLVAAWLFRIAHNAVVNHLRDRRSHVSIEAFDFDVPDARPAPFEQVARAEEWQTLREEVATLPDHQQDLLALKVVGGLTSKEIGKALGQSAGAVRVELHRIIKRLRARCGARSGARRQAKEG